MGDGNGYGCFGGIGCGVTNLAVDARVAVE